MDYDLQLIWLHAERGVMERVSFDQSLDNSIFDA
jgi:hypothetical protein